MSIKNNTSNTPTHPHIQNANTCLYTATINANRNDYFMPNNCIVSAGCLQAYIHTYAYECESEYKCECECEYGCKSLNVYVVCFSATLQNAGWKPQTIKRENTNHK